MSLIPPTPGVRLAQGAMTLSQIDRVKLLCHALATDEQFLWLDLLCEVGVLSHAQAWEIIGLDIAPPTSRLLRDEEGDDDGE